MVKINKELRFIFVGGSTFVVQLLLTLFLLNIGVRAALAVGGAFGVAFIAAYLMHKYWTFSSGASHLRALPRYFSAQMLALACGAVTAEFCANFLVLSNGLTAVVATVVSALLSFYLSSRWVFSD